MRAGGQSKRPGADFGRIEPEHILQAEDRGEDRRPAGRPGIVVNPHHAAGYHVGQHVSGHQRVLQCRLSACCKSQASQASQ